MLWELIDHGSLAHWWEYPFFVLLMLILVVGPTAIWLIWITRPRNGGHDGQE